MLRGRPSAHVVDEVLKIHPPFAEFNSPSSVAIVELAIRIPASILNGVPYAVFRPFNFAMRSVKQGCGVALKATTRLGVSVSQFVGVHDDRVSTLAETLPSRARPSLVVSNTLNRSLLWFFPKDKEAHKLLSDEIKFYGHETCLG